MYDFFNLSRLSTMTEHDILFLIFSVFGIILILAVVLVLITVIGHYKVFKKAGKSGWAALIPIYNTYVGCQICGINTMWVFILLAASFLSIIIPFLSFISTICSLYFRIIFSISMAKSFGKSEAFALGLIFFGPIFYLILGLGDSKYIGADPMKDVILEMFGVKNDDKPANSTFLSSVGVNENVNQSSSSPKYCSNCGTAINSGNNYCPNCGYKL